MFPKLLILAMVLGVSSTIVSCQPPESAMREETEEFHKTFAVKPDMELSVENRNGNVIVHAWDQDSVDVFALKKTRSGRRELKKVDVEIDHDEKLLIRSDYRDENARVSVNYEIKVPKDLTIQQVETANGNVRLRGVEGDAVTVTSNGKIAIEDVVGYVSATTKNGAIDITGTTGVVKASSANGTITTEILNIRNSGVDFTLSNGNIRLYVADGLNADIEMGTTNGKMSVHELEVTKTESSPKRIKGKIGKGGPRIYARTTNGNIDLFQLKSED
jgi:hypothetical protein